MSLNNTLRFGLALGLLGLAACTTRQDAMTTAPLLDRVFPGDFLAAAACTHNAIQSADYAIQPQVTMIPSRSWAEVQTTATTSWTGTIFGQVSRFEDIDGKSYRVTVRAPYTADGDVAVAAIRKCAESQIIPVDADISAMIGG